MKIQKRSYFIRDYADWSWPNIQLRQAFL